MNKVIYPVVFTGNEQHKLDNLKGYTKIGYKSEIIATYTGAKPIYKQLFLYNRKR